VADGIRRFRTSDAEALAALTLAAIRETGLRDYSPEQVTAWSARHPGANRFIASAMKGDAILVAVDSGDRPIAYVLTEPDGHIDMLYCHPDHTGKGVAGVLLSAAEAGSRGSGIIRLFTEASELARPVFERAGFAVLHRRDFEIAHEGREVAIHNYAMEKQLG
jgi:putative acetyltransferase